MLCQKAPYLTELHLDLDEEVMLENHNLDRVLNACCACSLILVSHLRFTNSFGGDLSELLRILQHDEARPAFSLRNLAVNAYDFSANLASTEFWMASRDGAPPTVECGVALFANALAAHTGALTSLKLCCPALSSPLVLTTLCGAVHSCGLTVLRLIESNLTPAPASLPPLGRLLAHSPSLTELVVCNKMVPLLTDDAGAAVDVAAFCDGIAESLRTLSISDARLYAAPRACAALLRACTEHPSLVCLSLRKRRGETPYWHPNTWNHDGVALNDPLLALPACSELGDAAGVLVRRAAAISAPLRRLSIVAIGCAEIELKPLFRAMAAAQPPCKLISLIVTTSTVPDAFVETTVLPCVRACSSLTKLHLLTKDIFGKQTEVLRTAQEVAFYPSAAIFAAGGRAGCW